MSLPHRVTLKTAGPAPAPAPEPEPAAAAQSTKPSRLSGKPCLGLPAPAQK